MAAIVKLGNCAGKRGLNALIRSKYLNIVDRSVSTCRARLLVGCRLDDYGSRPSPFRGYAAKAAAATEVKVQNGGPLEKGIKQPNGQVTEHFIDQQLMQLDKQVQTWGRVDYEQVTELLDLVKRAGTASTQQAVMLTRCTGSLLVKHTPEERMALCDQVCKVLESVGVEYNIQIYNALLRVKLENGHAFVPSEALNDIEMQRQLVPNRITYQLLLSRYCDMGDVDGARKILEYMKSQNLMLNETIFNALVKGHVRNGDMAGASEVMTSMRELGIEPTADTYTVLMCDLAEKGDIKGIEKVLNDTRADYVTVTPRHLFSVILSLTKAGHTQHVEKMLKYVMDLSNRPFNHDALNCTFQLVVHGYDEEAVQVYCTMNGRPKEDGTNALLRCMVMRGRPIDALIAAWKRLIAENVFVNSLEPVAYWCLRYQSPDYCLELLDRMKSMGFTVKPHYFAPLLKHAAGQGDVTGTSRILKQMFSSTSEDDSDLGVVNKMAVTELLNSGQSLDVILDCLKAADVQEDQFQMLQSSGLIQQGKLADAAKLIEDGVKFPIGIIKSVISSGFFKSNFDTAELGNLLAAMDGKMVDGTERSLNSGILLSIVKHPKLNSDVAKQVVDEWCKHNLKMYPNYEQPISFELRRLGVSKDEIEKLQPLFVGDRSIQVGIATEDLKRATIKELESWVEDAKKNKNRAVNKLEYHLLIKYCAYGAVDKADELKAQMDSKGVIYSPELLHHLALLSADNKRNLDDALNYKQQLDNDHPSFYILPKLSMNIAHLLLINGRYADAIDTLKDHPKKHPQSLQRTGISDGYLMEFLGVKLVSACCEKNDVTQAIELTNALFDCGYIKHGAFRVLQSLVNGYVERSDVDSVLTALEYCVKQYNHAPGYSNVLKMLIVLEDADRLQKAIDLVSTVVGEQNMHLDLVKDFIECGKLKQARRLVEAPGLKADMDTLLRGCDYFINTNKEKELSQFIDVTKHLSGIDRSQMILQLLRLHARNKDTKKLMDAFSLYEDEQVLPKPNVLRYVAKVLEAAGEPVPFEVPPKTDESHESETAEDLQLSSLSDIDVERLGQRDAEYTDEKFATMTSHVAVAAAKKILIQRNHKAFQTFLKKLTAVGNTESVAAIEEIVIPKRLSQFTAFSLMHAHLNRNTLEEFMDKFEEAPVGLQNYLSSGLFLATHERQPALMDRLESLAMKCAEETGGKRIRNCLYCYYMMTEQMDKVKHLVQKFEGLRESVGLSYVTRHAYQKQKENVLRNVIDFHRNDRGLRLTFPYNYLLLLKCEFGVWADGVQCYHDALGDGLPFESLWIRSLQALHSLAVTNDQPVPWPAGALENRMKNLEADNYQRHVDDVASASNSSDSDSDSAADKS